MSYTSQTTLNQWRKVRLDRMLVDYFLRNGYYDSANKLADARGLRDLTNVGMYYSINFLVLQGFILLFLGFCTSKEKRIPYV